MKAKTADLIGPALDWTVAKCLGVTPIAVKKNYSEGWLLYSHPSATIPLEYSTKWAQGGPIIEREWLDTIPWPNEPDKNLQWECAQYDSINCRTFGPTPLIAAMRCFVASRLGDEVDVPDELV